MPRWTRATLDGPAEVGAGTGHRTKAEQSLTSKIGQERYERLLLQNEKLRAEMGQLKGSMVDYEMVKRQIISANTTVKNHLLAIPSQIAPDLAPLTDALVIEQRLRQAIVSACNELAYEHAQEP